MKNTRQSLTNVETEKAIQELMGNLSSLSSAVTAAAKESAIDAIKDTAALAKAKTSEVLADLDPSTVVQEYPKTAVTAAFALGLLVGVRRLNFLKPLAISALTMGSEWALTKYMENSTNIPTRSLNGTLH